MSETVIGGCLCGEVRFEAPFEPLFQILCHCTDCQTVSGSASYCAYVVPIDSVELKQGETTSFGVQSDAGRTNTRRFCPKCGSRLWAELETGIASVNGMALDDRNHFNPSHNHRTNTAPDWCQINQSLEDLPAN